MSLSQHVKQIQALAEQLSNYVYDEPLPDEAAIPNTCVLATKGLRNLINELPTFEACLSDNTPYMSHFLKTVSGSIDDDTEAEQIFEDLIIFFREKALRLPPEKITQVEAELLDFFEQNQSNEDPESMVRLWYWNYLPLLIQYSFWKSTGIVRRGGLEYLETVTGVNLLNHNLDFGM